MSDAKPSTRFCPSCGAAADGTFCSDCGTRLAASECTRCHAALRPGARFCSECGARADPHATPHRGSKGRSATWIAAGACAAALFALIVVLAFRIGARSTPGAGAPTGAVTLQGGATAPDISNMSPRERAARLYDRVMRLHEEQKRDSVAFFAPMALNAYAAIPDLDLDGRYDVARIAMVAGALPLAQAQDDTILQREPTHLLGLLLGADLARGANNETRAKQMESSLVASADRERKRDLPEYQAHSAEIESALRRLGGPGGSKVSKP